MKYEIGDKVLIKSLDWYNENKNKDGDVWLMATTRSKYNFIEPQSDFCGKVVTIEEVHHNFYTITDPETDFYWTDEMIEGLVEDKALKQYEVSTGSIKIWDLPNGYIFKDENGNVINTTKIVLEKKKEYPKTYEECCNELGIINALYHTIGIDFPHRNEIESLIKLLICRNAYWKIAGEKMGLGKPWEPDWDTNENELFVIANYNGTIVKTEWYYVYTKILAFPTKEIRGAFYKNFKELIEQCKELL